MPKHLRTRWFHVWCWQSTEVSAKWLNWFLLLWILQSIFRTPLSSYDVLLELHPECLPHPNRILFPPEGLGKSVLSKAAQKFSPWLSPSILKMGIRAARDHLIIGLNPVEEFVQDLKVRSTCFLLMFVMCTLPIVFCFRLTTFFPFFFIRK